MIYLSIVSIVEFILIVLLGWIFYVQQKREKKLTQIAEHCVENFQNISDIIEKADEALSSGRLKEAFSTDDETGISISGCWQYRTGYYPSCVGW